MNFRRIVSKSSSKSTSSSKSLSHEEEVSRLLNEIESLKQTVESLKISVESRDAAIGTLAREKEKLYVELKSVHRTNRNLHQQLLDERDMHSKEKEYLMEENKRLSGNKNTNYNFIREQEKIEDVKCSCNDELKAKDEIICNICSKYLKIKTSKKILQKKLEKAQQRSKDICDNVVFLLNENRQSVDNVLDTLLKTSSGNTDCKKYLKILKTNSKLQFENTQLKVCLSLINFAEKSRQFEELNSGEHFSGYENVNDLFKGERNCKNKKCFKTLNANISNEVLKLPKTGNFFSIHDLYSPYFRRKVHYYSDPCLAHF